ncbi:MAG: hypothetical protein PHY04_03410 [Candidatus ainarchaeum sp.]|jgi:hypothetical protein|nr:hypothetical protein [Candidatus ainarchaeum sp.]MDD3085642.1 hypothetical protein [Candidatus ainarchaeum sp.]MDD4128757.1 hypothetical protein [Candidatus ainarchaeum sp.]MDD4468282.1 hypothetical protein [Candidatus ainarchaeum sp.]HPM85473.1 hypothetical protein [archaeon]
MDFQEILVTFSNSLLENTFNLIPIITVILILIITGYVLGWIAKTLISNLLKYTGFNEWFNQQHLLEALGNRNVSDVVGSIMKWYIFFIFLKQSIELINLVTINEVLGFWINLVLVIIAALVVVIVGLIFGRLIRNLFQTTKIPLKNWAGIIIEIIISYIAIVMGIRMIGLPTQLLEGTFLIAFGGITLALSLVIGIGFGLAVKDEAKEIVKKIKKNKK